MVAVAACQGGAAVVPDDAATTDALQSCWSLPCEIGTDPNANLCGTCSGLGANEECPGGFVCTSYRECLRGPWPIDARPNAPDAAYLHDAGPPADAGPPDADLPDARTYVWPPCDDSVR